MKLLRLLLVIGLSSVGFFLYKDMYGNCCASIKPLGGGTCQTDTPSSCQHCPYKFMQRMCKISKLPKGGPMLMDPTTCIAVAGIDPSSGMCNSEGCAGKSHLATDHTCDVNGAQLDSLKLVCWDPGC